MPQHFVGDPVEDVEDEEAEWENRSGYGVDALGPVHKALVKRIFVVHGHRGRLGEDAGSFCSRSILVLQAVAQPVTPEVKTTALSEQLFLLHNPTQRKCSRGFNTLVQSQVKLGPRLESKLFKFP